MSDLERLELLATGAFVMFLIVVAVIVTWGGPDNQNGGLV